MSDSPPGQGPKGRAFAFYDRPYLLLVLTTLFWASNILLGRAVVGDIPPVALAQMRWTLAFAIVLPFALPHIRRDLPRICADWKILTILAVCGISLYNTFLYLGVQTTSAVNAAMLSSLFPIVVAVIGFVFYRDRLTPLQVAGIVVSCIGAAIILTRGSFAVLREFAFVAGDLWMVGCQIAYALYTVLLRERPGIHPLSFVTVTIFIGQLLLAPFTLAEGMQGNVVTFDLTTVASVLYVAIFPAVLAYTFFNRAVELIGSNRTAPFFHLVPLFTSLGAVVLLGERVLPYHVIGICLILGGIAATQVFRARPAPRS